MKRTATEVVRAVGAVRGVSATILCLSVDSTNDELRRRAEAGRAGPGTVLVADEQTAGRGRRGRIWHSPPGLGLYLSWLVHPSGPVDLLPRWTLLAAVATCESCRHVAGNVIGLKWPNDIVAGGRKLGGVLADLKTTTGTAELILGVGVNVDHRPDDLPPEVAARATSLRAVGGDIMDRAALARRIVQGLVELGQRLEAGDWETVRKRWMELAPGAAGPVRIVPGRAPSWTGVACGVDDRGALLVRRDEDGQWVAVHDGETVIPIEDD